MRSMALVASVLLAQSFALVAQQPARDTSTAPTISVDSRLVNIPVVVRNDKGALALNLKKEDFSLLVDSKQQTIRYFDLDTDLPLTLGLLVDTSGSQRNALDDERTASSAFLDQMLTGKDDKAFVIEFARSVELLQDVTSSRPKLQAALKELDTQQPDHNNQNDQSGSDQTGNDSNNPRGQNRGRRMGFGAGTTLYDSVFLASDEVISKQKGRKALIVLTDGVDRGSKESLASAIEAAQRADTIVYAIYFKGQEPGQNGGERRGGGFPRGGGWPGGGYPGGGGGYPGGGRRGGGNPGGGQQQQVDGKKILQRITQETGGRMFEVSKKDTLASIYDQIGQELRSQYRLGYIPDTDTAAEGYHKIDLAFTSKDKKKYTIQTRDGYYTGKK